MGDGESMRICFVAHAGSANTVSWSNHFADVLEGSVEAYQASIDAFWNI